MPMLAIKGEMRPPCPAIWSIPQNSGKRSISLAEFTTAKSLREVSVDVFAKLQRAYLAFSRDRSEVEAETGIINFRWKEIMVALQIGACSSACRRHRILLG
eukprot:8778617-Pyramimonas_sp.AAC.1